MNHRAILLIGLTAMLATSIVQAKPGDRLRERMAERRAERAGGDDTQIERSGRADNTGIKVAYGSDDAQRVLVWPSAPRRSNGLGAARPGQRAPLAVFIHGGGWKKGYPELVDNKPAWFNDHGWAFASIGYRLLPGSPVEEQARDIGRALTKLRSEAARFGYDPDRILLFGHSAGAHLTALVSSDPGYAGDSFAAIKAAILIDGACYDVPAQIAASPFMAKRTYIPAFGGNPDRQLQLSPITHAGGRDVGDWLLLYTSAREDAQQQSDALSAALRRSGARTEVFAVPAKSPQKLSAHREINVEFGTPGYAANAQIEAIMRRAAS